MFQNVKYVNIYIYTIYIYIYIQVGDFNPSEKYESVGIIIPDIWKNETCSQPPTSIFECGGTHSFLRNIFNRTLTRTLSYQHPQHVSHTSEK